MRYVVAVADEGSFTRAAQRCFVVQSALSHQIKALERELGVVLFARTSRRVEITDAGRAFVASARVSLEAAHRATTDAAATSGELRGTLSVGAIQTVTAIDLPAVLGEFRRRHPAVRIEVRGGGSDEFVAGIVDGTLDVAVLGVPEGTSLAGVATRELARERHVAVVSATHRHADRRRLRIDDLAEETFADYPAGTLARAQSDLAFQRAGVRRDVAFELMNVDLILGIVRQDLAVTLQSPGVVPADPGLHAIAVTGGPTRVQHLAWSDFNPSPAARAFVDLTQRET